MPQGPKDLQALGVQVQALKIQVQGFRVEGSRSLSEMLELAVPIHCGVLSVGVLMIRTLRFGGLYFPNLRALYCFCPAVLVFFLSRLFLLGIALGFRGRALVQKADAGASIPVRDKGYGQYLWLAQGMDLL